MEKLFNRVRAFFVIFLPSIVIILCGVIERLESLYRSRHFSSHFVWLVWLVYILSGVGFALVATTKTAWYKQKRILIAHIVSGIMAIMLMFVFILCYLNIYNIGINNFVKYYFAPWQVVSITTGFTIFTTIRAIVIYSSKK